MNNPNIILPYKYPLPLVWIDTNAIIEMHLHKHNPVALTSGANERAGRLYDRLRALVQQQAIIILESQQKEEYGQNSEAGQIDSVFHSLTLGMRTQYRSETHDAQLHNMIKHHHGDLKEFTLDDRDIFHEDPLTELKRAEEMGFTVIARMPFSTPYKELLRDTRDDIHTEWEAVRQKNNQAGITYEQQLPREFLGHMEAIRNGYMKLLQKKLRGEEPTFDELSDLSGIRKPLDLWYYVTGKKDDFNGMKDFMKSPYYQNIPYIEIHTRVVTKIVTGDHPVDRGDYQDLNHVSSLLPYMDYMIVDSATRDRLYELQLPQKYNTKVYALDSYQKFIRDIQG